MAREISQYPRDANIGNPEGTNKVFKEYENIHKGKKAVFVAGGPSLDKFIPLENVIYTGVNLIGKHRLFDQSVPGSIKLDYYFFGDRDRHMPKDFEVTRQKFGGCIFYGKEFPSLLLTKKEVESLGGKPFEQNIEHGKGEWEGRGTRRNNFDRHTKGHWIKRQPNPLLPSHGIFRDISQNPCYGHTICIPAVQFLIYTGVSVIYLVGADCSGQTSFGVDAKSPVSSSNRVAHLNYVDGFKHWINFKMFLREEKINVKIISINPVGLRGYFEEIYY